MDDNKLDFPSPTEAKHDETTGMYTMIDPEPASIDGERLVKLDSGLWIERPNWKEFRILWIETDGAQFQIECDESVEFITEAISQARESSTPQAEYFKFHEPIYGLLTYVPATALVRVIAISSQIRDMDKLKEELANYELQKRMSRLSSASQGASPQQAKEIIRRHSRQN